PGPWAKKQAAPWRTARLVSFRRPRPVSRHCAAIGSDRVDLDPLHTRLIDHAADHMISADPVKVEIIREGSVPKPLAGGSKVDYRVDSPRDSCSPEPRDDDGSRDFGQTGRLSKRKLQGTRQTRFAHRYGYRGQGTGAPEAGPATRANPRPRP